MKRKKKQLQKKKLKKATTPTPKKFWTLKRLVVTNIFVSLLIAGFVFIRMPEGQHFIEQGQAFIDLAQQKTNLKLDQVPIQGHNRTKIEDISKALNVTQGMPILDIDLNQKKEAIMALPWIRNVVIERQLPNMLIIQVEEKNPIAIWQHHQKYSPIDEEGKPIADDKTVLSNILLVVGEDAPQNTPQLIQELEKYPEIYKQARSAVRVGNRRWDLYLNDVENGIVVRLPETDIDVALERLKEFNETGQILSRDLNVIDLKLPDRLIIRSGTVLEQPQKTKGKPKKK